MKDLILPLAFLAFSLVAPNVSAAADIKLSALGALAPVMQELKPQFEKTSGNHVEVSIGTAGAIADRIRRGKIPGVAVVTAPQAADLQKDGKVINPHGIASVGVGVAVRQGKSVPDTYVWLPESSMNV